MSFEAIRSFHPLNGIQEPKLTEDHQYPRKVSARQILNHDWSNSSNAAEAFTHMFIEKYGTYNLVTSRENRELMKFQKVEVFSTPEAAYKSAGIRLIKVGREKLQRIKSRDSTFIDTVLSTDANE